MRDLRSHHWVPRRRWRPGGTIALFGVLVALVATTVGPATAAGTRTTETKLVFAINQPLKTSVGAPLAYWANRIEKLSKGTISISRHYGDLGGETALIKGMQQGTVDGSMFGTVTLGSLVKELNVFSLPFLFTTLTQGRAVQDSRIGTQLLNRLTSVRLKGLAYGDRGFRNFGNNKRPVRVPADMKGLLIRAQPSLTSPALVAALGAKPTVVDGTELIPALQQGVMDGLDSGAAFYWSGETFKYVKYYSLTRHEFSPVVFVMADEKWNSLTSAQRAIISKATTDTRAWQRRYNSAYDKRAVAALRKQVPINNIQNQAAWRAAVQPVYDRFVPEISKPVFDAVQKIIGASK